MAGFNVGSDRVEARMWCKFKGDGVHSIYDSYNVSSIGDLGQGGMTLNFTVNMADNNYSWSGATHYGGGQNDASTIEEYDNGTSSTFLKVQNMRCLNDGTQFEGEDSEFTSCIIHGN